MNAPVPESTNGYFTSNPLTCVEDKKTNLTGQPHRFLLTPPSVILREATQDE
jgi:hypothetical protein